MSFRLLGLGLRIGFRVMVGLRCRVSGLGLGI